MTQIVRSLADLRAHVRVWRLAGEKVAVVPTMGALHAGHLSLVAAAKASAARVIVTIFVNPAQFNNPGDLARYPRTEQADALLLAPLAVDMIFAPEAAEVYPAGFATKIVVSGISAGLDGDFRPGHFEGVATVVAKLFSMTQADRAYFGDKDYQQLLVVRRMARDLNLPIDILGCPTLRDHDGLALSSRNAHLTPADRARAPALYRALQDCADTIRSGTSVAHALERARAALQSAGFSRIDYVALHSADTLAPMPTHDRPARLLAAVWAGEVRLIDNIAV